MSPTAATILRLVTAAEERGDVGAYSDVGVVEVGVNYRNFIASKIARVPPAGFVPRPFTAPLFPFQRALVAWAVEQGRAAIFADTGLGKTRMQLEWAHQVVQHTGRPVLGIAPLGVVAQTADEAARCGIADVRVIRDTNEVKPGINLINFDRAVKLALTGFGGVFLDESSILKNEMGRTRNALIAAVQEVPYRLACTATPAPNDHTELGNHAEFLGVMEHRVMLSTFFINDLSNTIAPWRLKNHASGEFWAWVASWARCVTKPSDVGDYDDSAYALPPLHLERLDVQVNNTVGRVDGMLFRDATLSATSLHAERRMTAQARAEAIAAKVLAEPEEAWIIWCDTDYEAAELRRTLPDHAVEVHGSDTPEQKADRLLGFARGDFRILLTKPKIAGFGMNWQHCARMAMVGVSYEWESFYQKIRRIWRFGQKRPCHVYVAVASTEGKVWSTVEMKADQNDDLRSAMLEASRAACIRREAQRPYTPLHLATVPGWLRSSP